MKLIWIAFLSYLVFLSLGNFFFFSIIYSCFGFTLMFVFMFDIDLIHFNKYFNIFLKFVGIDVFYDYTVDTPAMLMVRQNQDVTILWSSTSDLTLIPTISIYLQTINMDASSVVTVVSETLIASNIVNNGSYLWTIPSTQVSFNLLLFIFYFLFLLYYYSFIHSLIEFFLKKRLFQANIVFVLKIQMHL